MDADTLRKNVWEEMLYASMRSNYFAELVRHYLGVDRGLRVGVLVATSGTVATALSDSGAAKIVVPIVAAVASFWLLISQYGSMARDAADLHEGWGAIADDYEALWISLADSADAETRFRQIYKRAEGLSKSGTKFPNKTRRLEHWLEHASTMAKARYA